METQKTSLAFHAVKRTGIITLKPRQNGRHFPDDILKLIFLNKKLWTSIKLSLKFVPRGPNNNIPALVQIMVWHWSGDESLSEPMMVNLLTHICVTRPQWDKYAWHFGLSYQRSCKGLLFQMFFQLNCISLFKPLTVTSLSSRRSIPFTASKIRK